MKERKPAPSRPLTTVLKRKFEKVVGARHVITNEEALEPASHDATPNLPPVLPAAWVRPGSTAEVAEIMRLCAEVGVFVTPRGAGTGKAGGSVASLGGIVLGLDRLTTIDAIDEENSIVDVRPGVILQDLQNAVEERNLFYPPDPASLASCTIGGNVATNAGGPRALRYGVTREFVLGLEVVLATGEVIKTGRRTVKGVAGYDLTALLCGSEGTLGIITGMTLKLLPRPRSVQTALCVFPSAGSAARAVAAIMQQGLLPRTLEYLDGASISALRAHGVPYRFPVTAQAALIVETDGDDDESTFAQLGRVMQCAEREGASDVFVASDVKQRREIWETRRRLSEATRRVKKFKTSEDIVVPRALIPEMVARLGELGEDHQLATCAFGHAGDGNLHAQVLFDHESERPRVEALLSDLLRLTVSMGGTITGEHGIGSVKRQFLALEQGPAVIELQRQVKRAFDPAGVLNPGKILPDPERTPLRD